MGKVVKFPNRIGYLRTKRNLSQEYVAYKIGMSWRHYNRIENGEVEPGATKLRRIAKLFNCRMEDLFDD